MPDPEPTRREVRSPRLEAAERVLAADGFEAALSPASSRSGVRWLPSTTISVEGRSPSPSWARAERFFATCEADRRVGRAGAICAGSAWPSAGAERHPNFLRLLVAFAVQPSGAGNGRLTRGRAFGTCAQSAAQAIAPPQDDPLSATTDQLARFALAAFDGAFVASQSDRGVTLQTVLEPLATSLVAARRELLR